MVGDLCITAFTLITGEQEWNISFLFIKICADNYTGFI